MDVTKPYKFIGFGSMDVTKPYTFIGFGAMDVIPSPLPLPSWRPFTQAQCDAPFLRRERRTPSAPMYAVAIFSERKPDTSLLQNGSPSDCHHSSADVGNAAPRHSSLRHHSPRDGDIFGHIHALAHRPCGFACQRALR